MLETNTEQHLSPFMKSAANSVLQNVNVTFLFSYTDAISLFIRQQYLDQIFHPSSKRFAVLYIHSSRAAFGTYDIIEGDVVCRNSRDLNIHDDCLRYNIEQFIQDCFGETVWTKYRHTHPYHHHRLCSDFEDNLFNSTSQNITLECAHLIIYVKQFHNVKLQGVIAQSQSRHVTFNEEHSALVIPSNVVQQLREAVFDDMACDLCNVIVDSYSHDHLTLYITGDRLKHQHFREHLRRYLQVVKSDIKRYLMPEGRAFYTYGFTSTTRFDEKIHFDEMRICVDVNGEDETVMWPLNILIKNHDKIYSGLEIIWGERATFYSNRRKHSEHQVLLFRSKLNAPCYINDVSCHHIATIEIHPPPEGWPDEVNFHYSLVFTDNGPRINATDFISKKKHKAELIDSKLNVSAIFIEEPTVPVLKGAVSFRPNTFVRKAVFSYGVMHDPRASQGQCPDHLRITIEIGNSRRCRAFHKIIKKGQLLHHQQVFSIEFDLIVLPFSTPQRSSNGFPVFHKPTLILELYRTQMKDPMLNWRPEDDQCEWVANICSIPVDEGDPYHKGIRYELKLIVKYIGLEFVVTRKDTKEMWKNTIIEL
ncbi:uncharacterized protein LOC128245117 [Mya arenaria]|uniref:uncharacterized protein LOC128245117 n=1 Tax=Mya arenaria TaxID=6604 RepID=UPI0022E60B5A|nr:uncharacterized protein LOC128245117 [Mya arenaria]